MKAVEYGSCTWTDAVDDDDDDIVKSPSSTSDSVKDIPSDDLSSADDVSSSAVRTSVDIGASAKLELVDKITSSQMAKLHRPSCSFIGNSHTGISAYVQTAKSHQIRLLWPLCALINDIYLLTYCIYVTETDQFDTELVAVVLGDLESRQSGRVLIVDEIRAASQQQLEWLGLVVIGTHVERCVPILHPTTQLLTAGTSRHQVSKCQVLSFNISASE